MGTVSGKGRRQIDDPTTIPQAGNGLLGDEESSFHIDGHEFVKIFLGCRPTVPSLPIPALLTKMSN